MIDHSLLRKWSVQKWSRQAFHIIIGVVLVLLFLMHSLTYDDPRFFYNIDYDNYLSQAFDLSYGGKLPLFGPWVTTPVTFRLGPAYIYMLGACMRVVGTDPLALWHALLCINLLAVIVWTLFWMKDRGLVRGSVFGLMLVSIPALYEAQKMYFFHAQWALLFVCGFIIFLYLFDRTNVKTYWYGAVFMAMLSMHFHFTAFLLLFPLFVFALTHRKTIGLRMRVMTFMILLLGNLSIFLRPSVISGLVHLFKDPGSGTYIVSATLDACGLVPQLGPFGAWNLLLLVLGIVLAVHILLRERTSKNGAIALILISFLPLFLGVGLFVQQVHILPVHYVCVAIPFLVLAYYLLFEYVCALSCRMFGQAWCPHILLAIVAGAVIVQALLPYRTVFGGEGDYYYIQSYKNLYSFVLSFRSHYGLSRRAFEPGTLKVHGYLPPLSGLCKDRYVHYCVDRAMKTSSSDADIHEYNVRFVPGSDTYLVEKYPSCLILGPNTASNKKGRKSIVIRARSGVRTWGGQAYINIVLSGSSDAVSVPGTVLIGPSGQRVPLTVVYTPVGDQIKGGVLIIRSLKKVVLRPGTSYRFVYAPSLELQDLFVSKACYSKASWGLLK